MKIVWSPQARRDLNRIVTLISQDKKAAAVRWAKTIEKKVFRLARFPKSGRVVPELRREEIREIVVGDYRVIYKLEKTIAILTVFHGARSSLGSLES